MVSTKTISIALIGNPNSGKTTVFNLLTGLSQKTGNFPGITVEKKSGKMPLDNGRSAQLIDFPGTYSFYPTSKDERVVLNVLSNPLDPAYPDVVLYIADALQLEKHLLMLTQIRDLGIPTILAINRIDLSKEQNIQFDVKQLSEKLSVPVIEISGRSGENIDELKQKIKSVLNIPINTSSATKPIYVFSKTEQKVAKRVGALLNLDIPYRNLLIAHHVEKLGFLTEDQRVAIRAINKDEGFEDLSFQVREVMYRYDHFLTGVNSFITFVKDSNNTFTDRVDQVVTHRVFGPVLFFAIMFLVFQAIFAWAETPMNWIEGGFTWLSELVNSTLPESWFTSLLTDGILAGLGGILVFIPQIAILFFLISLLEEIGYMARAVFIFDRIMKFFGLNGRSIVALISGGACAIPAVMSTRTISNWKERLITIMVTPLISCSARIPVYAVLIGFVVPSVTVWGVFNAQGLAFMGLYLLGIGAALISALVFKIILKSEDPSYLMLELPEYNKPSWKNIFLTVKDKVMSFIIEAGKIIMIVSIILWVLASYGPAEDMNQAVLDSERIATTQNLTEVEKEDLIASKKLEASYAGHIGKTIEPVIKPLGFDWKIGIALITSFAAREVFVGTMATIYSIGSVDDEATVSARLAKAKDPETGLPVYTMATSLSLLIFYAFAMQCMSTLAVVKRETNSWKWPIIQFVFMSLLAYLGSLFVYQMFS